MNVRKQVALWCLAFLLLLLGISFARADEPQEVYLITANELTMLENTISELESKSQKQGELVRSLERQLTEAEASRRKAEQSWSAFADGVLSDLTRMTRTAESWRLGVIVGAPVALIVGFIVGWMAH